MRIWLGLISISLRVAVDVCPQPWPHSLIEWGQKQKLKFVKSKKETGTQGILFPLQLTISHIGDMVTAVSQKDLDMCLTVSGCQKG